VSEEQWNIATMFVMYKFLTSGDVDTEVVFPTSDGKARDDVIVVWRLHLPPEVNSSL
jgi:hypothetical protein